MSSPQKFPDSSLSEKLERAYSDGRSTEHDGRAMAAAEWCLVNRGKKLSLESIRYAVLENFRDGDSAFFHAVARAMEELEREGAKVENGLIVSNLPVTDRAMIAYEWERWRRDRTKVEVRLAELKERGFNISKSRYHAIVKQDSLKSP